MKTAFVTGSTGLLGNNLVRLLLSRGIAVRALARSTSKARAQFGLAPELEIVAGDLLEPASYAQALNGCDVVFHTAAYFRESYRGGRHQASLHGVNVQATGHLLQAAYAAGVRKFIHTSSIAVVHGPRGSIIDESMARDAKDADDYYQSKMDADALVKAFLADHKDMFAAFVMPGWMHGPGDLGPTSAGQFTIDYLSGKLPGIPPGTVAFVDARDVAQALLAAATCAQRGEHYLAAGHHIGMAELIALYEQVTGVAAPRRVIPIAVLWVIAGLQELMARVAKRPALLSLATVRTVLREAERTRFDLEKTRRYLGVEFRPIADTIRDEVAWLMQARPHLLP